jgi:hypothetical protein
MNFKEITSWVEAHPGESIVIGGGGVIFLLWIFGAFGSGKSSDSGASNMAAAYYAAEAQQAVVGGQIQVATIGAARDTAVAGIQANAATAINSANDYTAITVNGQNASEATTINQSNNDAANTQASIWAGVSTVQANDQLLSTYSNNATSVANTASNNAALVTTNKANNDASVMNTFLTAALPLELQTYGGSGVNVNLGGQAFSEGSPVPAVGTPAWYQYVGYDVSSSGKIANPAGTASDAWRTLG